LTGIYCLRLAFNPEDGGGFTLLPDFSALRTSIAQHELFLTFTTQTGSKSFITYSQGTVNFRCPSGFRLTLEVSIVRVALCVTPALYVLYMQLMCVLHVNLTINNL
jgi:hypothetical protein